MGETEYEWMEAAIARWEDPEGGLSGEDMQRLLNILIERDRQWAEKWKATVDESSARFARIEELEAEIERLRCNSKESTT